MSLPESLFVTARSSVHSPLLRQPEMVLQSIEQALPKVTKTFLQILVHTKGTLDY